MAETRPYVSGLFPDRDSAERAWHGAVQRGYEGRDIDLAMSEETRQRHFSGSADSELDTKAAEGAGIGAGIGGTLGAIAAAVAAVGTTVVLPGAGLVLAGPLAGALAGAVGGGAAGGLVGALIGWNIPEEHARRYEAGIRKGGIVMGLRPRSDDDARTLADDWRALRGSEVHHSGAALAAHPGAPLAQAADDAPKKALPP